MPLLRLGLSLGLHLGLHLGEASVLFTHRFLASTLRTLEPTVAEVNNKAGLMESSWPEVI